MLTELWALAVCDLGLSDAEFWDTPFYQIYALVDRYVARERRIDERAALQNCLFANAHRDSKKKPQPYTIDDFMPKVKRAPKSTEEALAELQAKSRSLGAGAGHSKLMGWKASFKGVKPKPTREEAQAARAAARAKRGK